MSDNGYQPNYGDDSNANNADEAQQNNGAIQPDIGWLFGQLGNMNQQQPAEVTASSNNNSNNNNSNHNSFVNHQPMANNFQALLGGAPFPNNPVQGMNPPVPQPAAPVPATDIAMMQQIQAYLNQANTTAPSQPPASTSVAVPVGQQAPWQMPTNNPVPMAMPQLNQQGHMTQQQIMQMIAMITAIMQTQQQTTNTPNPFSPFQANNMAMAPFQPPMNAGMFGPPQQQQQLPWNLMQNSQQNNGLLMFTAFIMSALQQQLASQNAVVAPQQLAAMMQAVFPPHQQGMPNNPMPTLAAAGGQQQSSGGVAVAAMAASHPGGAAAASGKAKGAPKKKRAYNHEGFPSKLHRLIRECKDQGKDHIIRFTDDGLQFQILDTAAFETEVLPAYFRHGHISSFKRLLRMYGFRRTQGTWEEGTFEHEKFQREAPELCKEITRVGLKYGSMY